MFEEPMYELRGVADRLRLPYRIVRDNVFGGKWPHRKVSQRKRYMTDEDMREAVRLMHQGPDPAVKVEQKSQRDNVLRLLQSVS